MKKSRDKTNDGVRGVTTETWLLAHCFVAHSAHCVRSPASPSLILQAVGLHNVDVIITIHWMDRPVRCLGCALCLTFRLHGIHTMLGHMTASRGERAAHPRSPSLSSWHPSHLRPPSPPPSLLRLPPSGNLLSRSPCWMSSSLAEDPLVPWPLCFWALKMSGPLSTLDLGPKPLPPMEKTPPLLCVSR